jgi:hypothetical protein
MAKNNYLMRPVEELVEVYSNALRYYVENRIKSKDMHIEDFAVEVANFAECFYATIQALPKDG